LINYQVEAESRPAPISVPPTSHFMILADTPFGLQPLNTTANGEKPSQRVQPYPVVAEKELEAQKEAHKEEDKNEEKLDESKSNHNGKDTKQILNKMLNDPGLKLDQYKKQQTSTKVILISVVEKSIIFKLKPKGASKDWASQETLLLLEALEMYKDDWNQVCIISTSGTLELEPHIF
jgi:SWI/SNF related-matrix-associated actin-dependent regulator of chromatin subfamily C